MITFLEMIYLLVSLVFTLVCLQAIVYKEMEIKDVIFVSALWAVYFTYIV